MIGLFRFDAALRTELKQHWLVVAVAFCTLLFGFSAPTFALPFLFPEVIKEFGWSREQATLLASAKYLTGAVAALLIGRFLDATGVWIALIVSTGIGGIALVMFLFVDSLTSYYLVGLLLGFAGPGSMVAVQVLVARTFHDSAGTAVGFALLGTALGSVVVPLVASAAIGGLGWRFGMASLSFGIWCVSMPLLIYGLFAKSLATGQRVSRDPAVPADPPFAYILSLTKERTFWLLAVAFFITAMIDQAYIQHQVLILNDLEMSRATVAIGISAMGAIGIVCRVAVGNILDRSSSRGLAALYMTMTGTALLAFVLVNPLAFAVFVILRAISHATVLLDGPVIAKHCYGTRNLGTVLGVFTAITSLGFAIGPWLVGRLFDTSGSYASSFALFAVLPLGAAAAIAMVTPRDWLARRTVTKAKSESSSA